jgi:chromosome partitioning protein
VLREIEGIRFVDAAIGSRKAFSNAAAQGMAVTELRPPDPKASEELLMLYRYVFDTTAVPTEVGSVA